MATCPTCEGRFEEATFCPRDGTKLVGETVIGRTLGGRYKLLRKIGEGAIGEVYEAEHALIKRRVAVKLLQRRIANDSEAMARLQREAESTTGLGHANIVDSLDFGYTDEGQVYLVMEWLDGENLQDRLDHGPIDITTAIDIAAQAAAGLAEAHERGVIHRDLKPANLFLTHNRRGALVVKVLDFGIAKLALHETKLTGTGVLIGTPNYMAPEQAFGEQVDVRTDVYALGVILYEMLTGSVPFVADSPVAVLHQHTSKMPVPPSARAPERGISEELEAIVLRCMAKKPEDRYGSMTELGEALASTRAAVDRATTRAAAPTSASVPGGSRRQLRAPLLLGAAVAIGGAIVAFVAVRGSRDRGVAPRDASTPVTSVVVDARGGVPPDASTVPTPVVVSIDAASQPVTTTLEGRAKRFAYRIVVSPALPEEDHPFELAVTISDFDPLVRDALTAGKVTAEVKLFYFRRHDDPDYKERHRLGVDGRMTFTVSLPTIAKHHGHLHLLIDGQPVDDADFELFPEIMR